MNDAKRGSVSDVGYAPYEPSVVSSGLARLGLPETALSESEGRGTDKDLGLTTGTVRVTIEHAVTRTSLSSIQALRGCAVLAVVLHHAALMMRSSGFPMTSATFKRLMLPEIGAAGVDVFFTLSGFLMILIATPYLERRRSVADFFLHRLIRIWPLYALATCTLLAKEFIQSWRGGWPLPADFTALRLAGLAFIPSFNEVGMLRPIFAPGWTLSYEMYFYACFAVAILFAAQRRELLFGVAALLLGGMVAGLHLPNGSIGGTFFSDPVAFEFLIGAAICVHLQSGRQFPLAAGWWFVAAFGWFAAFAHISVNDGWRLGTRGIAAAFLFIAMLKLEGSARFPKWLLVMGDASYSIYLVHWLVMPKMVALSSHLVAPIAAAFPRAESAALLAAIGSVIVGWLCFHAIETPLLRTCRSWARL